MGILIVVLFPVILFSACVSTGSKGAPGMDQYYITRDDYREIRLFQEVPATLNYTVLEYLRISSREAYLSEALLERLYTETIAHKGNALIEIRRNLKLNTSGNQLPHTTNRGVFNNIEGALISNYFEWTATIVLLQE